MRPPFPGPVAVARARLDPLGVTSHIPIADEHNSTARTLPPTGTTLAVDHLKHDERPAGRVPTQHAAGPGRIPRGHEARSRSVPRGHEAGPGIQGPCLQPARGRRAAPCVGLFGGKMRRAARGGVLLFGRAMSEKDGPRSSFEGSVPPADPGNAARPGFRAPVRSLPSNQSTWRLFCGIWPAGLQRLRAATGPAFLLGPVCATASQPTYQSINRSIVVAGDPCPRYSSWGASRGRTSRRGRTMLDCGV